MATEGDKSATSMVADDVESKDTSGKVFPDGRRDEPIDHGRGRRMTATLHRYLLNELRAVRFGPQQDSLSSITIILSLIGSVHLLLYLLFLVRAQSARWDEYVDSNQFLVGVLLWIWIVGYNVVSWVIWHQFERDERYSADDYYVEGQSEGMVEGGWGPTVVQLPSEALQLAMPL